MSLALTYQKSELGTPRLGPPDRGRPRTADRGPRAHRRPSGLGLGDPAPSAQRPAPSAQAQAQAQQVGTGSCTMNPSGAHQGGVFCLLSFLGCSLEPPTFASAIKCHQKSTSNSAGSSVGSLAPPRATPRLGGVYVPCQYFPCSFVLALRELGLRSGVKAQLPLRASSRGVLPGAGALECGNRRLSSSNPRFAHKDSCL
jgi:hypothetical protein